MDDQHQEENLIKEYLSGNQEALAMIFELYKNRILNFCLRILGNRADAEDVTADVFLALFSQKYTHNPQAKFSTWLYTVARNSCISRIRKRKNFVSLWFTSNEGEVADAWDIPDTNPLSREELDQREISSEVRKAISKLPLEQREAIVLREYHSLSYEEIAKVLHCSLEKVKILLFRAREQLRTQLSSFIKEQQK